MTAMIRRGRAPDGVLAVLDVGTSKVTCLIAARGLDGQQLPAQQNTPPRRDASAGLPVQVLGFGHQRARGL